MARTTMTDAHKAALAEGRSDARAVKAYLDLLSANRPSRGKKWTVESVKKRLAIIEETIKTAPSLKALQMAQERMDLEQELECLTTPRETADIEKQFLAVAKRYGQRKGIGYAAWREVGVSPSVLREAGITR